MPTTLMQITCPRCDTSYGVDSAAFPPEGRAVRCARCQEVWTAKIDVPAVAEPDPVDWEPAVAAAIQEASAPLTDSPPIADDNPPGWQEQDAPAEEAAEPEVAPPKAVRPGFLARLSERLRRKKTAAARPLLQSSKRRSGSSSKLVGVVAGLCAVVLGLVIWRTDIVRLMPQTAIAFKAIGMPVNLRGITLQDMQVRTETVDGAPVLVIEGAIRSIAQKPVEIPRLRFIVRDERGSEIYAWNAVLEQAALKPGETLAFRSRLASPPAEARDLEIRFFHRRDLARGAV